MCNKQTFISYQRQPRSRKLIASRQIQVNYSHKTNSFYNIRSMDGPNRNPITKYPILLFARNMNKFLPRASYNIRVDKIILNIRQMTFMDLVQSRKGEYFFYKTFIAGWSLNNSTIIDFTSVFNMPLEVYDCNLLYLSNGKFSGGNIRPSTWHLLHCIQKRMLPMSHYFTSIP